MHRCVPAGHADRHQVVEPARYQPPLLNISCNDPSSPMTTAQWAAMAGRHQNVEGRPMASVTTTATIEGRASVGDSIQALGMFVTRFGLVAVFAWIGAMKFTAYEANAIQPLVANSPLMSWLYKIFSVQAFSNCLGVLEIAIAVLIATRPISAVESAPGSGLAAECFLG